MNGETHSQLAGFIWSICNLLRGPYTRYMDDRAFEDAAFAVLSKVIYETIPAEGGAVE